MRPQLLTASCPVRGHFFGAQSPKKRSYFLAQKSVLKERRPQGREKEKASSGCPARGPFSS
jgi:hypothetical protein